MANPDPTRRSSRLRKPSRRVRENESNTTAVVNNEGAQDDQEDEGQITNSTTDVVDTPAEADTVANVGPREAEPEDQDITPAVSDAKYSEESSDEPSEDKKDPMVLLLDREEYLWRIILRRRRKVDHSCAALFQALANQAPYSVSAGKFTVRRAKLEAAKKELDAVRAEVCDGVKWKDVPGDLFQSLKGSILSHFWGVYGGLCFGFRVVRRYYSVRRDGNEHEGRW